MKKYIWLLAFPVVAFVLACGAPSTSTSTGGGTQVEGVSTTLVETPSAPAPTGPFTAFKSGTYEVGNGAGQVKPGKYKTTVPAGLIDHCYWERLSNLDGGFDGIIANENLMNAGTTGILVIKASDKGVRVTGDCEWKLSA